MINKRIIRVLTLISFLFVSLIGYLTYFQLTRGEDILQSPYNKRQWEYDDTVKRGSFLDRNGKVLAYSQDGKRFYSFGALYSHVIGYNSNIYGRTMLEARFNKLLLGRRELTEVFNLNIDSKTGYDLTLTVDHALQSYAANRLGGKNGSVVAINPKTGEVLALVSKPDFDPNEDALIKNWNDLTEDEQSPLLARATSGLYPPGSTFKIITTTAALENGLAAETFDDIGSVTIGGAVFENFGKKANGVIDLKKAFALSSNFAYCTLGAKLGSGRMGSAAERFGFNKSFDFDIDMNQSKFPMNDTDEAGSAALAIGQGKLLATPVHMALAACAVANDGVIMKPYLVAYATNASGGRVYEVRQQQLYRAMSAENAAKIKDMMVETVKSGTATASVIRGVTVAGKTGTSENELLNQMKDKEHAWYVCFAPAEDPQIAVAVMLEYSGGSGGGLCAPIARDILRQYFKK